MRLNTLTEVYICTGNNNYIDLIKRPEVRILFSSLNLIYCKNNYVPIFKKLVTEVNYQTQGDVYARSRKVQCYKRGVKLLFERLWCCEEMKDSLVKMALGYKDKYKNCSFKTDRTCVVTWYLSREDIITNVQKFFLKFVCSGCNRNPVPFTVRKQHLRVRDA